MTRPPQAAPTAPQEGTAVDRLISAARRAVQHADQLPLALYLMRRALADLDGAGGRTPTTPGAQP